MPKVAQMLDSGWQIMIYKNDLGTYEVKARHPNGRLVDKAVDKCVASCDPSLRAVARRFMVDDNGYLKTDDFTPEQALTRMAYKVLGEII
jgi:hypothetical protein